MNPTKRHGRMGRGIKRPTSTDDPMQAIVQNGYGSADVLQLEQVARPVIADDEVLMRVHAAGLDRGTWHLMTGQPYLLRLAFGLRRPKNPIPGRDVAGTVVAVGPAVARFSAGDEVYGIAAPHGSFAEYAAAREDKLARKPGNLSFEQAAVVPVSAMTASPGTDRYRARPSRPAGTGHRRLRRNRELRRAVGPSLRGRGDRHVQPSEDRVGRSNPSGPTMSSTTPTTSPTAPAATT